MDIFYIDIEKFKYTHGKNFLEEYADIELKTEKRFFEYTIGRYLIKSVGEKIYKLSDTEIIKDKNGKPMFKNTDLFFNISHSKNYIVAVFDNSPCGIDIELIKPRDLEKLSKYYHRDFNSIEKFYEFWTQKEAEYKLGTTPKGQYTSKFKENYIITVTSNNKLDSITVKEYE